MRKAGKHQNNVMFYIMFIVLYIYHSLKLILLKSNEIEIEFSSSFLFYLLFSINHLENLLGNQEGYKKKQKYKQGMEKIKE